MKFWLINQKKIKITEKTYKKDIYDNNQFYTLKYYHDLKKSNNWKIASLSPIPT